MVKTGEQGAFAQEMATGAMIGLAVLRAEMEALALLLPGVRGAMAPPREARTDAAIEADFDNMPV